MRVEELMTAEPYVCRTDDSLQAAAQLMWDKDCGCLPVVDGEGQLAGVITDRDICMGAFTQRRALDRARVVDSMQPRVRACGPQDSAQDVLELLAEHKIRRVPVIDSTRHVVGIITLGDLGRAAAARKPGARSAKGPKADEVVALFAAVTTPRRATSVVELTPQHTKVRSPTKRPKASTKRASATAGKSAARTPATKSKRKPATKKR